MANLIVRHPPNRKILNMLLFFGGFSLILSLLTGTTESFWFVAFLAMIFVIPTAILVVLMQRVFVFDELTKEITIYRTVYPKKKVRLDGSRKKYNLSLERIYMWSRLGPGTLLVLLLKENNKAVYKITEGLWKKSLLSLATKIQKAIGCSFSDKSNHIACVIDHYSWLEEIR